MQQIPNMIKAMAKAMHAWRSSSDVVFMTYTRVYHKIYFLSTTYLTSYTTLTFDVILFCPAGISGVGDAEAFVAIAAYIIGPWDWFE